MDYFILLKMAHLIGASVLLGTGAGIAFFMLMAHRTNDPTFVARTSSVVVVADMVFTATAVIAQPITGILLALHVGWSLLEAWIVISIALYVATGLLWLPVVWIQIQLRNIAQDCSLSKTPLTNRYHRLFAIWFMCGIPAFIFVLTIFWLMTAKPTIPLF